MRKQGKRVVLDYILTDVVYMILILVVGIIGLIYLLDFVYKGEQLGYKWLFEYIQRQIFTKKHLKLAVIEVAYLTILFYFVLKYLFRKSAKINRKLAKFIKQNDLIIYEYRNGNRRIKDRCEIYFKLKDDKLIINIYLHGSSFDPKLKESREKIEDLFETSVSSVNIDFGVITYEIVFNDNYRLKEMKYLDNGIYLDLKNVWNYDTNPHALIAGTTGTGKTYFVNYLITNLVYHKADLFFVDPKKADIKAIGNVVNPKNTACTELEILELVKKFYVEISERQKRLEAKEEVNITYRDLEEEKPMFLVFDELAAFKATADKKVFTEIENYLKNIILVGRSAGGFVILIAQQPNAEIINTGIRDQLGLKIAFGNVKTELKHMLFGSGINLHTIDSSLKGVGYMSLGNGEAFKYFAPNLGSRFDFVEEIKEIQAKLGR